MTAATDMTKRLRDLVENWQTDRAQVNRLERELDAARADLRTATNELGKFITPEDAKPAETFCFWHDGELLEVYHPSRPQYLVGENGKAEGLEERYDDNFAVRVRDSKHRRRGER